MRVLRVWAPLVAVLLSAAAPQDARLQTGLDAIAARLPPGSPGCQIAASRDGRAVVNRAFGLADLEQGAAITSETVFDAASVGKQFTAAAVLMLVQDGRLKLSDDIRAHLPEMPDYGTPITVEHLLTHTSGLRNFTLMMSLYEPSSTGGQNNQDYINLAARQRGLDFQPGEIYAYSNTNYLLLATIVARVSGQSFAAFTRERIFTPLGMTRTQWRDDFQRIIPGRAQGYLKSGETRRTSTPNNNVHGSGGLLTTASDLLLWLNALDAGTLGPFVSAELERQGRTNAGRTIDYARGVEVTDQGGRREVSHAGGVAGYRAWAGRYPDQGVAVAVLCNAGDEIFVDDTAREIAGLLLPSVEAAAYAEPEGHNPTAEQIDALVGLYLERDSRLPLTLARDGDRLRVDGAAVRLVEPGLLRRPGWGDLRIEGAELHVTEVDGRRSVYRRTAAPIPTPDDLQALTGDYGGPDLGVDYTLSVASGRLLLRRADRPAFGRYLNPVAPDLFVGSGVYVEFERDPDGRVSGFEFLIPPRLRIPLRRSPDGD